MRVVSLNDDCIADAPNLTTHTSYSGRHIIARVCVLVWRPCSYPSVVSGLIRPAHCDDSARLFLFTTYAGRDARRIPDVVETRGGGVEVDGKEILQLYRIKTNEDVRDKPPPPRVSIQLAVYLRVDFCAAACYGLLWWRTAQTSLGVPDPRRV